MSTDLDALEQALDALLVAIIEEDRKVRDAPDGSARIEAVPVTAESLARSARMTRLDLDVADLVRGPVRAACWQGVRRIGEAMFKALGSTSAMSPVAERVASWDFERWGLRASIIEHAWNGIGKGTDRWCA